MRIAVVSDIHANLQALLSVVEDIRSNEEVELKINLGDIVGYGANPNECIEICRDFFDINILGNHDAATCDLFNYNAFNPYAKAAIEYTQKVISEKNLDFLKNLPFTYQKDDLFFVHASPLFPDNWSYILSRDDARTVFLTNDDLKVIFVGHSHLPLVYINHKDSIISKYAEIIKLEDEDRAIVNVGSVGQPRDGDSRACYVIFDTESFEINYKRLTYDLDKEIKSMKRNDLPEFLINRLYRGK